MRKSIILSSAAIALILVGCGSSNNESSNNSVVPEFAKKMTKVNKPVVSGAFKKVDELTDDNYVELLGKESVSINTLNKLNEKYLGKKLSDRIKKETVKLANKTVNVEIIEDGKCRIYHSEKEYGCNVSGTYKTIEDIRPVGNECVHTIQEVYNQCKNYYERENGDSNSTYYWNYIFAIKGKYVIYKDENNKTKYEGVGFELIFKGNGYTINNNINNDGSVGTQKYTYNGNINASFSRAYDLDKNNTFVDKKVFTYNLKGAYKDFDKYYNDGQLNEEEDFVFNGDYLQRDDLSEENVTKLYANGWINAYAEDKNYVTHETSKGIIQNFVVKDFQAIEKKYDLNDTNDTHNGDRIDEWSIKGGIGDECMGGYVNINTVKVVKDDINDSEENSSYALPYDGLIEVRGAGNTKAELKFYEDENGTHLDLQLNGETRTYNNWSDFYNNSANCREGR